MSQGAQALPHGFDFVDRSRRLEEAGWTVEVVDGFDIFHRTDELRFRLATLARRSGVA